MASFSKLLLSGSTNGKGIKISNTATPGNLIHTAVAGTSSFDEVWLYATNTSSFDAFLTIEFGDTLSNIVIPIQAYQGLFLIVPGLILQNSLTINAFANITNIISIHGYVNRIS